jgi:hypothetical protein
MACQVAKAAQVIDQSLSIAGYLLLWMLKDSVKTIQKINIPVIKKTSRAKSNIQTIPNLEVCLVVTKLY